MQASMKISLNQFLKDYRKVKYLGCGQYGDVYLYRNDRLLQQYALKIIIAKSQCHRQEVLLQIQNMRRLQHRNIVKIFKYYEANYVSDQKKEQCEIGILLEAGTSSLQECFKNKQYRYTFQDIKKFIFQFIQLGAFLQKKNIVHRDIKPANIIVFGQKLEFKLADFGLCCQANRRPNGFAGTLNFCSPYLNKFYEKGNHSQPPRSNPFKDDVYSLAITCLQLIKYRYRLQDCPLQIRKLLQEMRNYDQRQRPTFCDLLNHHAFSQKHKQWQPQKKSSQNQTKLKISQKYQGNLFNKEQQPQKYTKKRIFQSQSSFQQCGRLTQKSIKQVLAKKFLSTSGLKFKISSFCKFHQNYILCGDYEGQLAIIDIESQQVIKLSLRHKNYISKIKMDRDSNIWIAGADGKINFIKNQDLLKCIVFRRETEVIKIPNLFGKAKEITRDIICVPQQYVKSIFHITDKRYISEILCIDEHNFAVGFSDGTVYVKWQNQELKTYRIHYDPITCLKIINKKLYSCDYQGFIKVYSLNKKLIQKQIYSCDNQLINIQISDTNDWINLDVINLKGQLRTINKKRHEYNTFESELAIKNIIDVIFVEHRGYYVLTSLGDVYYKNNLIFEMERERVQSVGHWNNIQQTDKNELVLSSSQGTICILKMQQ